MSIGLSNHREVTEVSRTLLARLERARDQRRDDIATAASDRVRQRDAEMLEWIEVILDRTVRLADIGARMADLVADGRIKEARRISVVQVEDGLDDQILDLLRSATAADEARVLDAIDRWDRQTELLRALAISTVVLGTGRARGRDHRFCLSRHHDAGGAGRRDEGCRPADASARRDDQRHQAFRADRAARRSRPAEPGHRHRAGQRHQPRPRRHRRHAGAGRGRGPDPAGRVRPRPGFDRGGGRARVRAVLSRPQPGRAGLGLPIARWLLEQLGGAIARTEPCARVEITLPLGGAQRDAAWTS